MGTATPGLTDHLLAENVRLAERLEAVRHLVQAGEVPQAARAIEGVYLGFRRCLALEEDVLMPALAAAGERDAARALRRDHRAIEHALDDMRVALQRRDGRAFERGYDLLADFLPGHRDRELGQLFPRAEAQLSASERTDALARLGVR